MKSTFTQLDQRTEQILEAIHTVPAGSDVLTELAELTIALEDAPEPKVEVVARLTVTRQNGWKTIVEVQSDASFHSFFKYYKQYGKRRSTKERIRTSNRIDGGRPPRLEHIAEKLSVYQSMTNPIVRSTIRIFNKPAYQRLLSARPDVLGLTKSRVRLPWMSPSPSGSLEGAAR